MNIRISLPLTVLLLFLTLASALPALAQDSLSALRDAGNIPDSNLTVQKILITGNNQTKDFVILREMSLQPGSPMNRRVMAFDEERIYSLGLFNRVRITPLVQNDTGAVLHVDVDERWYIFPIPIFGFVDRDPSKFFYGFGILHNNFRGRDEKLFAQAVFGYNPSVRLSYRNPFVTDDGRTYIEMGMSASKVRNLSIQAQDGGANFDEKHLSGSFTFGKRFGLYQTLGMTIGYEVVDITGVVPVKTLSPEGIDRYPTLGLGYNYDTRDLREYPSQGVYVHGGVTKFGVPQGTVDFARYDADLRGFVPLGGKFVLAGRTFTNLVDGGPTPGYNRQYFGYGERIRGHFKEVMEGESIFGMSTELHYTILPPIFFDMGLLPAGFSLWKFGISAAVFADAGTTWFRGEPVAVNKFAAGYGAGLDYLLPYSWVVRTEYAWNELGKGEFIFGIGASF